MERVASGTASSSAAPSCLGPSWTLFCGHQGWKIPLGNEEQGAQGQSQDLFSSHHLHCSVRHHLDRLRDKLVRRSRQQPQRPSARGPCVTLCPGPTPMELALLTQMLCTALQEGKILETTWLWGAPSFRPLGVLQSVSQSPSCSHLLSFPRVQYPSLVSQS